MTTKELMNELDGVLLALHEKCPNWKKCIDTVESAKSEIEYLSAIVAELPKTMDGQPVTPKMQLFYLYTLKNHSWVSFAQPDSDPRFCYSTRAAAEAAKEKA